VRAGEQHGGDGCPGVTVIEQQHDMQPQAPAGVGGRAELLQSDLAIRRRKADTAIHGLALKGSGSVSPTTLNQAFFLYHSNSTAGSLWSYLGFLGLADANLAVNTIREAANHANTELAASPQ